MDSRGQLDDAVRFLLAVEGCSHPFRLSRLVVLAAWSGAPELLSGVDVVGESFGFYIDDVREAVDGLMQQGCAARDEAMKCIRYTCGDRPSVDAKLEASLRIALARASGLSDVELNRTVIRDPRYAELVRR